MSALRKVHLPRTAWTSSLRYLHGFSKRINYAFLNFQEHPRGNWILKQLLDAGYPPTIVIEDSSKRNLEVSNKLRSELEELDPKLYPMAGKTSEILQGTGIARVSVKNHNNTPCLDLLEKYGIDSIMLGDCRILKQDLIKLAPKGVINTHPGYLPHLKGNHCSLYAITYDLPIGCTSHFIDTGVDTGPIIDRQLLDLDFQRTTYPELLWHLNVTCGDLAVRAIEKLDQGKIQRREQGTSDLHPFGTFTAIDPKLKAQAIKKLHNGGYIGGSFIPLPKRYIGHLYE